ncbi:MAG: hypothetical protein P4L46_26610 [Fimbriimonas sp.]|nr:hypothetical protein [Fimbriimonas sp.]
MKQLSLSALAALIALSVVAGIGCGKDPNDILEQQKAAKKMPPPTKEQLQKGFQELASNQDKAKQDEIAWAKAHPDKVDEVNKARALAGKPPLGQ